MPKRMLIVTTAKDFSLELFQNQESSDLIKPSVVYFDNIDEKVIEQNYDYLYFRDPFNDPSISELAAQETTKEVLEKVRAAYSIDGIASYDDLLFEDKWRQYQLFGELMPRTKPLDSLDEVDFDKELIKKRTSSRSRDIVFTKAAFPIGNNLSDYIVQTLLGIEVEYRVFVIGGKIIHPLLIKTSKTPDQKTKVTGTEDLIDPRIEDISNRVHRVTGFDLMGLDIAKVGQNFWLIEVNRSCQFKSFDRETGQNPATLLNKYLLQTA
jgi:hypothetical protein